MTNILTKTLRSSFLILAFSLFINTASAQNCATPPTCEQLGYMSNSADCAGYNILRCPFDQSKMFCTPFTIKIGDILFSDMTVSPDKIPSKKPIGIVVNTEKRLAIAIEKIGDFIWASQSINRGLEASTPSNTGAYNTQFLINYGKDKGITFPAAEACAKYAPQGMAAGKWFLPSLSEAATYYSNSSNENILKTFTNLGKTRIAPNPYITSAWTTMGPIGFFQGSPRPFDVSDKLEILPMINY